MRLLLLRALGACLLFTASACSPAPSRVAGAAAALDPLLPTVVPSTPVGGRACNTNADCDGWLNPVGGMLPPSCLTATCHRAPLVLADGGVTIERYGACECNPPAFGSCSDVCPQVYVNGALSGIDMSSDPLVTKLAGELVDAGVLASGLSTYVAAGVGLGIPCPGSEGMSMTYSGGIMHCVDGVWCNTECGGGATDCHACSVHAGALLDGICSVVGSKGVLCTPASGIDACATYTCQVSGDTTASTGAVTGSDECTTALPLSCPDSGVISDAGTDAGDAGIPDGGALALNAYRACAFDTDCDMGIDSPCDASICMHPRLEVSDASIGVCGACDALRLAAGGALYDHDGSVTGNLVDSGVVTRKLIAVGIGLRCDAGPQPQFEDGGLAACVDGVWCASACGGGDVQDCMACSLEYGGAIDGVCTAALYAYSATCTADTTASSECYQSACDGVGGIGSRPAPLNSNPQGVCINQPKGSDALCNCDSGTCLGMCSAEGTGALICQPIDGGMRDASVADGGNDSGTFDANVADLGSDMTTTDMAMDAGAPDMGIDLGVDMDVTDMTVDAVVADAGVDMSVDLGSDDAAIDLGIRHDSGVISMHDAGPTFSGGGGLACSIGSRQRSSSSTWWFAIAAIAAAVIRRKRR